MAGVEVDKRTYIQSKRFEKQLLAGFAEAVAKLKAERGTGVQAAQKVDC